MTISRKSIGIISIVAIVALVAFVALSATASAAVINVPEDYTTIQQAINNASDGDTIRVNATAYAGTTETIDVTQSNIIIRSIDGRAVVSANSTSDHVFNITDQINVTLQGFEIRDANGTTKDVAGIYMYNATECTISNNAVTNISATNRSAYGIYLDDSSNNTFSSSTSVSTVTSTGGYAYGIYLDDSSNNTFSSSTSVSTITAGDVAYGIYLRDSSSNTFNSNTSVSNITADGDAEGIYLYYSSNNKFNSSTSFSNITGGNIAFGIYLSVSSNNTFNSSTSFSTVTATDGSAYGIYLLFSSSNTFNSSTTISNITGGTEAYGIELEDSSNNRFSASPSVIDTVTSVNATAYGIYLEESSDDNNVTGVTITPTINGGNESYEFYSEANCTDNVVTDMTIGNPTTISFTYGNGIWIKRVETPEPDPSGKMNIGKYINASNVTPDSWIFLNVSYDPGDVIGVDESSLRLYHWNVTAWELLPQPNRVNTVEDYAYANITTFSQIAAFGNPPARAPTLTPLGLVALVGLLSAVAALTITRRKRR